MNNNYCIIYNPESGNGKSNYIAKHLQEDLNKRNIQYKIYQSKYSGHIKSLCSSKDSKIFIIIGGDGTFNEAINGFMNREADENLNDIKIGFLPGGTGNAFMHDLNGETYQKALNIILNGNTKKIDILKLKLGSTQITDNI